MAKKETGEPAAELDFEAALVQIQAIVQQLEQGSLGLEESLRQFEQGVGLIRSCHQTLERAEQRIQILTDVDSKGEPVLKEFHSTATIEENKSTAGRRKKSAKEPESGDSDGFSLF